jgi:hypothetical protein
MVDRLVTFARSSWWFAATLVWLATRLITTVLFLVAASIQGDNYWTKANPPYFDFLNIWDVEWYWRIFDHGYPLELPLSASGQVLQNEWAFMPVFPGLVKALTSITGLEFKFAAALLATAFSFAAALVIARIFERFMPRAQALWGLALVGLWCASPVLQAGYAESLGLFLLTIALWFILERRYLVALAPIAILAFTRPSVLAISLMLVLLWVVRWWQSRLDPSGFAPRERIQLAVSAVLSGFAGLGWSLTAALFTGRPDAYLATEMAWRSVYVGSSNFAPFEGWIASFDYHFGAGVGLVSLLLAAGLIAWMLRAEAIAKLGLELRLWLVSYAVYLLAVFFPQSSTWRLLLPMFVLAGALAIGTWRASKLFKIVLVIALIAAQFAWMLACWVYVAPDFTPP